MGPMIHIFGIGRARAPAAGRAGDIPAVARMWPAPHRESPTSVQPWRAEPNDIDSSAFVPPPPPTFAILHSAGDNIIVDHNGDELWWRAA